MFGALCALIDMGKVTCMRCGEKVFEGGVKLTNLYKLDLSSKENYIKSIMSLEDVSSEVATSWAEHGMFEQCKEKKRKCPECNSELKTWRAKLCLSCGENFKPWISHENT